MASKHPPQDNFGLAQGKRRGLFSQDLVDLVVPPLRVGAWTGSAGVLTGVGAAIVRDTSPFASGIVTGTQWFTLGGVFWFSRSLAMRAWGAPGAIQSSDRVMISGMAGTATGAVSGLFRGTPTKIMPAMIMWGLMGAGGQMLVHHYEARKLNQDGGFWSSLNPLRKLTDEEYMDIMREKQMKIDVDISLIDDRIAELRALEQKTKEAGKDGPARQK